MVPLGLTSDNKSKQPPMVVQKRLGIQRSLCGDVASSVSFMGHDDQRMSPPPRSSHSLQQVQEPRALGEGYRHLTVVEGQPDREQVAPHLTHGPDDSDSDSDIVGEMALGVPDDVKDVAALEAAALQEDSATCIWGECGIVFTHLPSLIQHIHNGQ